VDQNEFSCVDLCIGLRHICTEDTILDTDCMYMAGITSVQWLISYLIQKLII